MSSITTTEPAIELTPIPEQNTRKSTWQGTSEEEAPVVEEVSSRAQKLLYLKMISAGYSFFVAGINDGSLGPIIPYLLRQYNISTGTVSIIYAASCTGWLLAALINTHLSQYLDLGSMLALGAFLQTLGSSLRTFTPRFALLAVTFFIISLGQALQDAHANTFVAETSKKGTAHRWLGFIHAMYMLGCLVSPFVATAVAASGVGRWSLFYIFPAGLGVVNLLLVLTAFTDSLKPKLKLRGGSKTQHQTESQSQSQSQAEAETSNNASALNQIKAALSLRNMWLLSLFFFFYLGVAMTAGGWIVEYLVSVRKGDVALMGYVSAGFNGGCFLGRILLPEITHRWGEKRMIFIYCVLSLGLQLCFWLIPNIIVASIAITFLGFFTGPFFSTAMSLGTSLFPQDVLSTALAFVFVFAQIGGSIFPIITGALASRVGVKVLQPILVGLIVATGGSWLLIPRVKVGHQE